MSLVPVDTTSELAVTDYLTRARDWLATAVEMTGPEQIAAAKAEIATAAEATKQLGLSKEIQLDAQEMVRRAEYALGKAIRKGQEEGTIRRQGSHTGPRGDYERCGRTVHVGHRDLDQTAMSAKELAGNGQELHEIRQVSDVEPDEFNAALAEAKSEGNMSRANVVRKVKQQSGPTSRTARADLIADLAAQGYSSRQMPVKVGVTEESVRQIARDFDIEIPADRSVGRTRRINSAQIVENTATALEGLVMGVELIDQEAVDPMVASQWADSLTESLKVLNGFARQIRKAAQ